MTVTCTRGLDIMEFVIRVEDCFGIAISDKDLDKIKTVGDVYSYVRQRVAAGSSTECLSARGFYRLRRALAELLKCQPRSISPQMRFSDLFPASTRRQQWAQLGRALDTRLHPLQRPVALVRPMVAVTVILLAAGLLLGLFLRTPWAPLTLCPLGVTFAYAANRLTRRLAIETRRYPTVGSLTPVVLEGSFTDLAKGGASDRQVWEAIVSTLCDCAGMERSQVTPELRFLDIPGDL